MVFELFGNLRIAPGQQPQAIADNLFQALLPDYPQIFLQRAHWDGEGNWLLELPESASADDREAFKQVYKGEISDRFFPHHAQAILQLRRQKQLVLVDVGGRVQPEKLTLLEACSHYLVIASDPDGVAAWHEFCGDRGNLQPVAVIHISSPEKMSETTQKRESYLQITLAPEWFHTEQRSLPVDLLKAVRSLFPSP